MKSGADVPDFFSQLPRCLNCSVDGITVIPRSRGIQFAPLAQICVIWHLRLHKFAFANWIPACAGMTFSHDDKILWILLNKCYNKNHENYWN